jgi:hypothetical protein
MNPPSAPHSYKCHRFPAEIISLCVWLYFRFCLSYRDVEELMAERGVMLTYEAVRHWCRKFGQQYANQLRCRRSRQAAWFNGRHHPAAVPESSESDFAPRGGTRLGISHVRTRQTTLITIIVSTTLPIAPTPRAERS